MKVSEETFISELLLAHATACKEIAYLHLTSPKFIYFLPGQAVLHQIKVRLFGNQTTASWNIANRIGRILHSYDR